MSTSMDGFSDRIIWIDLEMTGLDIEKDRILEAACLVTDKELNIVAEGPNLIIKQPKFVLDNMNEWSIKSHTASGLTEASSKSEISEKDAEDKLLEFVREHTPPGKCPLGGSSIYMDKMFLIKYFPNFCEHLHYRLIDVSTVGELCRRWYPEKAAPFVNKDSKHRALDDIKASIDKLKYFRSSIFK